QVFARVELALVLCEETTNGTSAGEAQVGINVYLAHAVLDTFNDLFHRYAVGFRNLAAELIDNLEPFLRHRRGTVHHQVGVRNTRIDRLDAIHRQNVAGRRTGKLVGAVAGADGNRQRIHFGFLDELRGFFRIGQQLAVIQRALGTDAIFFTGLA